MKTCEQCGLQWEEPPEACPKCNAVQRVPIAEEAVPADVVKRVTCPACGHENHGGQPFCGQCGKRFKKSGANPWILVAFIVFIIAAIPIGFRIRDYNDPLSREIRSLDTKSEVMHDYIALMNTYMAKGYLDLDESRELRKVIERAKELRDKNEYGSEGYEELDSFTEDFTTK